MDNFSCSSNEDIANDVIYSDKLSAFMHAKFLPRIKSENITFHCKLTLCIGKANTCAGITVIHFCQFFLQLEIIPCRNKAA